MQIRCGALRASADVARQESSLGHSHGALNRREDAETILVVSSDDDAVAGDMSGSEYMYSNWFGPEVWSALVPADPGRKSHMHI